MYVRKLNKYLAILLSAAIVMTSVGFNNVTIAQASDDEPIITNTVSGNDPGVGSNIVDESQNDEGDITTEESTTEESTTEETEESTNDGTEESANESTEENTEESTEGTVSDGNALTTVEPVVVVEEATITFYVLDDTGVYYELSQVETVNNVVDYPEVPEVFGTTFNKWILEDGSDVPETFTEDAEVYAVYDYLPVTLAEIDLITGQGVRDDSTQLNGKVAISMINGDKYVSIPVLGRNSSRINTFKYSDTGIAFCLESGKNMPNNTEVYADYTASSADVYTDRLEYQKIASYVLSGGDMTLAQILVWSCSAGLSSDDMQLAYVQYKYSYDNNTTSIPADLTTWSGYTTACTYYYTEVEKINNAEPAQVKMYWDADDEDQKMLMLLNDMATLQNGNLWMDVYIHSDTGNSGPGCHGLGFTYVIKRDGEDRSTIWPKEELTLHLNTYVDGVLTDTWDYGSDGWLECLNSGNNLSGQYVSITWSSGGTSMITGNVHEWVNYYAEYTMRSIPRDWFFYWLQDIHDGKDIKHEMVLTRSDGSLYMKSDKFNNPVTITEYENIYNNSSYGDDTQFTVQLVDIAKRVNLSDPNVINVTSNMTSESFLFKKKSVGSLYDIEGTGNYAIGKVEVYKDSSLTELLLDATPSGVKTWDTSLYWEIPKEDDVTALFNAIKDGASPVVKLTAVPSSKKSVTYKGDTREAYCVTNTTSSVIPLNVVGDVASLDSYVYLANEPVLYMDTVYQESSISITPEYLAGLAGNKIELKTYSTSDDVTFNISCDGILYTDEGCTKNFVTNNYVYSDTGDLFYSKTGVSPQTKISTYVAFTSTSQYDSDLLFAYMEGLQHIYVKYEYTILANGSQVGTSNIIVPVKLRCNHTKEFVQGNFEVQSVSGSITEFTGGVMSNIGTTRYTLFAKEDTSIYVLSHLYGSIETVNSSYSQWQPYVKKIDLTAGSNTIYLRDGTINSSSKALIANPSILSGCENAGKNNVYCAACGELIRSEDIAPTGHNYVDAPQDSWYLMGVDCYTGGVGTDIEDEIISRVTYDTPNLTYRINDTGYFSNSTYGGVYIDFTVYAYGDTTLDIIVDKLLNANSGYNYCYVSSTITSTKSAVFGTNTVNLCKGINHVKVNTDHSRGSVSPVDVSFHIVPSNIRSTCESTGQNLSQCANCHEIQRTDNGTKLSHVEELLPESNITVEYVGVDTNYDTDEMITVTDNVYKRMQTTAAYRGCSSKSLFNINVPESGIYRIHYKAYSSVLSEANSNNILRFEAGGNTRYACINPGTESDNDWSYVSLNLTEGDNELKVYTETGYGPNDVNFEILLKSSTVQETCESSGVREYACRMCKKSVRTENVSALGHSFVDASLRDVDVSFDTRKTSTSYIGYEYDVQHNQWDLVRKYSGTSYTNAYSYFSIYIQEDITEFPLDIIIDKRSYSDSSYSVSLKPFDSTSNVASCNYTMTEGVQHINLTGTIPAGKYTLEIGHQVGYIDNTEVGDFAVRFPVSNTSATCSSSEVLRSQCSRCGLVKESTGIAALGHNMQHDGESYLTNVRFDNTYNSSYVNYTYNDSTGFWEFNRVYTGTSGRDTEAKFWFTVTEDCTEIPIMLNIEDGAVNSSKSIVMYNESGSKVASTSYIQNSTYAWNKNQNVKLTGTFTPGEYYVQVGIYAPYTESTYGCDVDIRFPLCDKIPTCTEDGTHVYECSRCDYFETREGDQALGHDMQHNTILKDFKVEFDRSKTYNYHDFEYVDETNSWRALPKWSGTSYSSEDVYFNFSISEDMAEIPIVFKPVGCATNITSTAVYLYSKSGTNYGYKTYYLYSGSSYKEQTLTWTGDFPAGDYYIYWSDYIDYKDRTSQYAPRTEIQFPLSDCSPTCTEYGKDAYECSRCKLTEFRNDEEPLGHDYVSDEGLVARIVSTTNSTYFFEYAGGVFKSNNQGRHSTTADTTIVVNLSSDMEVPWSVSSEQNCDRLTITVDGVAVVSSVSGTRNGIISLTAGEHTINLKYSKDSSANSGTDTATFSLPVQQSRPATHTEEGMRHLECSRCGDAKDEPIPKLSNYDLQIGMNISGNMASLDKTVQFCVEMRDENGNVITHGFDIYDSHGADTGEDLTFDENGKAYITLSHNESIVIKDFYGNEPYNITYEDVGSDGYSVIVTGGSLHSDTGITMPTVLNVAFVKSVIIPSGIEVTIQPYMILMIFCCLIIGAAMIRKFKKKF